MTAATAFRLSAFSDAAPLSENLPATVLQTAAHPECSSRYAHINTREVVAVLQKSGFKVHGVTVASRRSKLRDPLFAKHQVTLRHPDMPVVAGITPQIMLVNSHDGSSSAQALSGAFRQVCSNGLIVGTVQEAVRVRHSGKAEQDLIDNVRRMADQSKPLFEAIDRWSAIQLSTARMHQFARLAGVLRWDDPHRFDTHTILAPRRAEDDKGTLWSVFNRIQENAVRGGLLGRSASGRNATSRPLSEISANNKFNAQLWQLASEFADAS